MANYGIQFKDKNGNNVYPCPFPIGAVYISVNNINPKTYFGGTWERVSGGFLYGRTDDSWMSERGNGSGCWTNEDGGGTTYEHTLTIDQIPSHYHFGIYGANGSAKRMAGWGETSTHTGTLYEHGLTAWEDLQTGYAGGGKGHSHNLANHGHNIPYFACYLWKRIA